MKKYTIINNKPNRQLGTSAIKHSQTKICIEIKISVNKSFGARFRFTAN